LRKEYILIWGLGLPFLLSRHDISLSLPYISLAKERRWHLLGRRLGPAKLEREKACHGGSYTPTTISVYGHFLFIARGDRAADQIHHCLSLSRSSTVVPQGGIRTRARFDSFRCLKLFEFICLSRFMNTYSVRLLRGLHQR
jgi:hypothetical protein